MSYFNPSDLIVFADERAADPAHDLGRVRLRDRLVELHERIYPEMRARRWDLHPHWVPRYLISTARLEPPLTQINFLLLRYSKAETVVRLMKKELGEDVAHPYSTLLLGVRLDARGVGVEWLLTERAAPDGQNFKNKIVQGPPEKRHLRQLLADLGSDYTLTLESPAHDELLRMRCSRLVNLGTLDAVIEKYRPGEHALRVAIRYGAEDPRLRNEQIANEVLLRFGQLYLLYQFASWSPRNDFVSAARRLEKSRPPTASPNEGDRPAVKPRTESS